MLKSGFRSIKKIFLAIIDFVEPEPVVNFIRRYAAQLILLSAIILFVQGIYSSGLVKQKWDVMLVSGYLTIFVALLLSLGIDRKVSNTIHRLINRETLNISNGEDSEQLLNGLEYKALRYSHRLGLLLAFILLIGYISVFWPFPIPGLILETAIGVFAAYVVGRVIGRLVSYGLLGSYLTQGNRTLGPIPGHVDGAAGLKPVGELYFFQAALVAIAVLYIGIWYSIIPVFDTFANLSAWRNPFLALFLVALIVEFFSFFLPMYSFHKVMSAYKSNLLAEADHISFEIIELSRSLEKPDGAANKKIIEVQISAKTKRHADIENMPTWPIDFRIKRQFAAGNLGLLIPVIIELVKIAGKTIS